jgi:hypothetical protein
MSIDLPYLLVGLGCLLGGLWLGLLIGRRLGLLQLFTTATKVKNPEMWELLHYYVVDDQEQRKARRALDRPTGSSKVERTAGR